MLFDRHYNIWSLHRSDKITSERLKQYGFPVDVEPTRAKMGILVKETSEQVHEILVAKRG